MKTLLRCVLFFLLTTILFAAEIEFSGSSSFFYQYSDEDFSWSEMPSEFWRWRINPVLSIHGIPVVANVFVSSEESMQRQNMNRVYISSSPSASSRDGSFLSWISAIGIGASNPYFSNLTLNAANISGVNFAIKPGNFYFAAAGGRNRRAIDPDVELPGIYERNIYAVQTGFGSPFGSHFHICALYGKDENNSILEDSSFRVTPSENIVLAFDGGSVTADGQFRIDWEAAASLLTRDTQSPSIEPEDVPKWLVDMSGVNISSRYGWATDIFSSYRFSDNTLSLAFKRIQPGFESMGSPFISDDEMSVETRADRFFAGRQLSAGVWYMWKEDNLLAIKTFKTTTQTGGFRFGFFFQDFPSLNISYSPSYTELPDSTETTIDTSMLSFSSSYRKPIFGYETNSAIAFSVFDNSMGTGSSNYSSTSMVFRETVSLKIPVVISSCFSARRTRMEEESIWKYTTDIRGTWYPSNSLSMTLGGNYAIGDGDTKKTVMLNGGFPVTNFLTGNVSAKYVTFASETESDYTNIIGGTGISVVW